MEPTRQAALISTGIAAGFGALGIELVMSSFAFDPALAFRRGAI